MAEYRCIQQRRPEQSGAAAIASVAQHYGLPLTLSGISALLGPDFLRLDMLSVLFAARKLGFEGLPLEGDFEHLPEVPRPCIVTFERAANQQPEFIVLYEIEPDSVLIGNTATGSVERLGSDDFRKRWNGDAIRIFPDRDAIPAVQKQLRDLRDPRVVIPRAVGLRPLSLPRISCVLAAAAITLVAAAVPLQPVQKATFAAIGLCLVLALWSWVYSKACRACSRVAYAAGALPIAPAGAGWYAVLLALSILYGPGDSLVRLGVLAASGVHLFLVGLLVRSKLLCWPCIATAVSAVLAGIFSLGAVGIGRAGWEVLAAPCGFLLAGLIVLPARRLYQYQIRSTACQLGRKVIAETTPLPRDCARMVVYVRPDCPACALYETVFRPSLEETFGDTLRIEHREAGKEKVATPLYVISGTMNLLAGELPAETAYATLESAIAAALDREHSTLQAMGGLYVIGFGS